MQETNRLPGLLACLFALVPLAASLAACEGGEAAPTLDTFGETQADNGTGDVAGDTTVEDQGPLPDGAICRPNAGKCEGSIFLQCNADGSDWIATPCTEGQTCTETGCEGAGTCTPNAVDCDAQGRVIVCLADGSKFGAPIACEDGYTCKAGKCVAMICTPGQTDCTSTHLLTCEGTPPDTHWVETECSGDEICFKGACVECFTDAQCTAPMTCVDGDCVIAPLRITTVVLDDGAKDLAYNATLQAEGGTPPYSWSITDGALPGGLVLAAATGVISGKPTQGGTFAFTATVTDDGGAAASKALDINVLASSNLAITSKSPLPTGEEGTEYSFQFQAIGGVQPYGWFVTSGALPKGLTLSSTGLLSGIPEAHGDFEFAVRVMDVDTPPGYDTRTFTLTLKIAPLEITGDQVINLFLTKAVILPLITVVENIPLPYNTQLQAKGGVKPYTWVEQQLPSFLKTFIPKAGIPQGLTLSSSGLLSGSVTDTSLVFELKVPIVNYTLTGFFFMAQVSDSQDPADTDSAIFLIPTIPVNLGF